MKKLKNTLLILFTLVLLSSCSMFSDLTSVFAPKPVTYSIEVEGTKYEELKFNPSANPLYPNYYFSINVDSSEFYTQLSEMGVYSSDARVVLTYDNRYVEYLGEYYPNYVTEFTAARKLQLESYETLIVTNDEWLNFRVKADAPEGTTVIKFEFVRKGYAAKYTDVGGIILNIASFGELTEMADDASTRVYGFTTNEVLYNELLGLNVRGIINGTVSDLTFSFKSIYQTGHEYMIFAQPMNYTDNLNLYFDYNSNTYEYIPSKTVSYANSDYKMYIRSSGIFDSEDFKNGNDVIIRMFILDKTDNVTYYKDITYPVEDFTNAMSGVDSFAVATNGNPSLGAIVNTEVWIDGTTFAYSEDDLFSNVKVIIYDPSGEVAYKDYWGMNGKATSGTITSGWSGSTELFTKRFSYFTPKSVGKYKVRVCSYSNNGYNVNYNEFEFNVTN